MGDVKIIYRGEYDDDVLKFINDRYDCFKFEKVDSVLSITVHNAEIWLNPGSGSIEVKSEKN